MNSGTSKNKSVNKNVNKSVNKSVNKNNNDVNKNVNKNKNGKKSLPSFNVDLGSRKILQIGCGGVGSSMPYLYERHFQYKAGNITIMDKDKARLDKLKGKFPKINFVHQEFTKKNYKQLIGQYLNKGDIFADLAYYIGTNDCLELCHEKGIHFTNAAIEQWLNDNDCNQNTLECETLYRHQHHVREMAKKWGNKGATAVVGNGANPGWVSLAAKIGIKDWIKYLLKKNKNDARVIKAAKAVEAGQFNEAARQLNIQVIHISERDTQISKLPKKVDEFLCTWSCVGLIEEAALPAEMGWGTHENMKEYVKHFKKGPGNEVYMDTIAMNTLVRSYVPGSDVLGMVIPHEEANSLSYFLTVTKGGKAVYRPTVHYAYQLPDVAIASLVEYQAYGMPDMITNERVIKDEIESGADTLGAFLMSPDFGKWWCGSKLTIEESRRLIPHQNATIVQVSPSILAGMIYMIQHPDKAPVFPEDLPEDYVMNGFIKPYLGEWISQPVKWEPEGKTMLPKYKKEKNLVFQKFLVSPPPTR
ncbi:homospermidine synthase [Acanthocystis turfacea Chlorella virus Canal-1]|nr:homospermidine synthase [Acanthocystis turfacea Chlorella virus Canal-1]